jgi:hypothetical protein
LPVFGLLSLALDLGGGFLDYACGLCDHGALGEWRLELAAFYVLMSDPYDLEDGLVDEASLGWGGT